MPSLGLGLYLGASSLTTGVGYVQEARDLFARMDVQPSNAQKQSINTAIVGLKSAGLWTLLDALHVLSAHDRQAAKLNWVADQYNLAEIDGANLTFTPDVGFQGNGTSSALNTGFNPATAVSPKFTQNSGSIGFRSETAAQANTVEVGNDVTLIQCRSTTNVLNHRVNAAASSGSVINVGDGSGFFVSSRTGSAGADNVPYRDGVALPVNSAPAVSSTPTSREIWILGRNNTTPTYSARVGSLAFIGAGLTAQQVADLYDVFA